jgi:hypothetical protein
MAKRDQNVLIALGVDSFMEKMDEFYPKLGDTLRLPLRGGALRLAGPDDANPDGTPKPTIRRRF